MSEPQTAPSVSADLKEKASSLDEDIGNEFLGSWKSMSVTEDDAMDFNFDAISKGKKIAFNFDKLDMDFNLDSEFEKISSFKVDMGDLDFSSPPKKSAKPKDKSPEESSGGKVQGKQKSFAFSFDFNELDDFNFGPSLTEGETKSNSSKSQKTSVDISDGQGSRNDDCKSKNPPQSEPLATLNEEKLDSGLHVDDKMRDISPKKYPTLGDQVVFHGMGNSLTSTREQEKDQQSQPAEKTVSIETSSQQTQLNFSIETPPKKKSAQDTVTELQSEVSLLSTRLNAGSGGRKIGDTRMIFDSVPDLENDKMKSASPMRVKETQSHNSERNKLLCHVNLPVESTSNSETDRGDMNVEDISTTSVSRNTLHDANSSREHHNLTSKCPLATLSSGGTLGKLTMTKEKDHGVIRSRFFKSSEGTESQSSQMKNIPPEKRIICKLQSNLVDKESEIFNANHTQIGSNMVGDSSSHPGGSTTDKPFLSGDGNNCANNTNIREISNANHAQIGSNMVGDSSSHPGGSTTDKPVLSGDGNNRANNTNISSLVNLSTSTEQATKCSIPDSVNPKNSFPSMASMPKIASLEKNKLSYLKAVRKTPDLSTLNISGLIGKKSCLLNSTFRKEFKSMVNLTVSPKIHSPTSKMANSMCSEKQSPIALSLKRKTCEVSNTDLVTLQPLKRLSESPSKISCRVKAASERDKEQALKCENRVNSSIKKSLCDPLTSTFDFPRELNMTDSEIPLVLETDVNVEKAEAYAKELDDICNMLKKKHEEAKELLVRAVVNNNNLLMLNHPIYEEKICKVQKFAARLMEREIQT